MAEEDRNVEGLVRARENLKEAANRHSERVANFAEKDIENDRFYAALGSMDTATNAYLTGGDPVKTTMLNGAMIPEQQYKMFGAIKDFGEYCLDNGRLKQFEMAAAPLMMSMGQDFTRVYMSGPGARAQREYEENE